MTGHDNFHSTVVAWLKVALPLIALAILSTLFLVSRTIDPADAIPFAEVDIDDRVREPRLTMPTWAGVTDDGTAITVAANEARPGKEDSTGANASQIVADLETPDGGTAKMIARRGVLDTKSNALTVDGGVTISTSTDYTLETEAMTAALNRTSLVSEGAVQGTGPVGQINAGRMELTQESNAAGRYLLVFKNGVKLLYLPQNK